MGTRKPAWTPPVLKWAANLNVRPFPAQLQLYGLKNVYFRTGTVRFRSENGGTRMEKPANSHVKEVLLRRRWNPGGLRASTLLEWRSSAVRVVVLAQH